jgi:hypothetical protein
VPHIIADWSVAAVAERHATITNLIFAVSAEISPQSHTSAEAV